MSPTAQINAFVQSVYLRIKNRQYGDLTTAAGQALVANIIDFANGFIDELETEVNPDGNPIDWKWVTQLNYALGTATIGAASITVPSAVNNVIADEDRYIQIQQGGIVVSNWLLVAPGNITNNQNRITEDMCTVTGSTYTGITMTFSRVFNEQESNGTIVGDVTLPIPRLSLTNVKALSIIKPRELLVLGTAKNDVLSDIVKGTLTPSFVQKYQNLLQNAINRNVSSAQADTAVSDDLGYIRGIY